MEIIYNNTCTTNNTTVLLRRYSTQKMKMKDLVNYQLHKQVRLDSSTGVVYSSIKTKLGKL